MDVNNVDIVNELIEVQMKLLKRFNLRLVAVGLVVLMVFITILGMWIHEDLRKKVAAMDYNVMNALGQIHDFNIDYQGNVSPRIQQVPLKRNDN